MKYKYKDCPKCDHGFYSKEGNICEYCGYSDYWYMRGRWEGIRDIMKLEMLPWHNNLKRQGKQLTNRRFIFKVKRIAREVEKE